MSSFGEEGAGRCADLTLVCPRFAVSFILPATGGELRSLIAALPLDPFMVTIFEPRHDKTNKMSMRPAKTQISLGIRQVWSESSLSAWRKLGSLATYWAHSEDSDQTGRMPRLS